MLTGNKYTYDYVFDPTTTQNSIFERAIKPVGESVMEGFNGTVFAYGQTSSGKTHTMLGTNIEDLTQRGMIPRMVSLVFSQILAAPNEIEFTVKVSMIEIYMEKIRDLLEPSKTDLKVREDKKRGVYIEDVNEQFVTEESEVYTLLHLGN